MGLNRAFDISVSGITAAKIKEEIIASNLANIDTTRSITGGPYRRKMVVIGEKQLSFSDILANENEKIYGNKFSGGVDVVDIVDDTSPFQKVFKPGHPDADENGYVRLPNVSMSEEMIDLVYTSRVYQANITAFNATKKMAQDTLQLP